MDKIFLNHMQFYGYHGVYPEEQKLGQRFFVDVVLELDLRKAGQSDELRDTIDYSLVYERVKSIIEGKPKKLLETLAEKIADNLLQEFLLVQRVTVKIIKPDPPIPGHYQSVAVEITRGRK
jgi:dihydroneopterin aldolase